MKLDSKHTAFGRHETFPLRYAWLTKGFEAITERPDIFSEPDQAMVRLGVGRNMVSAIQYWMQAARLVEFTEREAAPTPLGEVLLGDQGDRYLEDESTIWVLHWLIASNTELATGFFWFFNRFAMPRFQETELRAGLTEFVEQELRIERSQSTLKSDTSTLLRMYAPAPEMSHGSGQKQTQMEDHLDTPMAQLRLVEQTGKSREFRSTRAIRPFMPAIALHFALAECFADVPEPPPLRVRDVLYGGGDQAAPGAVFRLSEEGLMTSLQRVMQHWPGQYELRDTAGTHQIYRLTRRAAPIDILRAYYQRAAA